MEARDVLFIFSGQLAGKGVRELADYLDARGIKIGPIKGGDLAKAAAVIGGIYYALKGRSYSGQVVGAITATNVLAEWAVDLISEMFAPKAAPKGAAALAVPVRVTLTPTKTTTAQAFI